MLTGEQIGNWNAGMPTRELVAEVTIGLDDEDFEPTFDFTSPEDVLFEVTAEVDPRLDDYGYPQFRRSGWRRGFHVDYASVESDNPDVTGAASYADQYGGFLEYTVESLATCPNREGFFILEGVTGHYSKGDGWTTDDDMDFDFEVERELTPEEVLFRWDEMGVNIWASEPENVA